VALLDIHSIYEGMPVELSYVPTNKGCNMLACAAYPGDHITVKLTCIKGGKPAEQPTDCKHKGTLRDMRYGKLDGCSWLIDLDNGERLDLGEQVDASVYKDGDRVTIGFTEIQNVWNNCMAGKAVQLDCIAKDGTPPPASGKCEHMGTLHDMRSKIKGCGWVLELTDGTKLDVSGQIDENLYRDGSVVLVGYEEVINVWNPCNADKAVQLTCIRTANHTGGQ
jgi:hypothetical protein